MKFYYFHLMPWPYLPDDFDTRHESAWVNLPNTLYDPERGHDLYHRYLDELEAAERWGWDGVLVNEHHQNAYGTMPSPNIIAAMLTQRTHRCEIGIIGNALPLRGDPLRIAEEIAMLDVISGGRIISGFVRGTGMEYYSTNVNPTQSRDRFFEAHDLIVKAWKEPGPFRFVGKYYKHHYVNIWPRPLQKPHPPIWLPGTGSLETIEFAARMRYPFMMVFSPIEHQRKAYQLYRRIAEDKFGYQASPYQLGFCVPTYVAESDEIARREFEPHILWLFRRGLKAGPFTTPPGYMSQQSMRAFLTAMAGMKTWGELTMDDLINDGYIIVGHPDTVIEKLTYYMDELQAGLMVSGASCGDMPPELVSKNMELFATKVMPALRARKPGA